MRVQQRGAQLRLRPRRGAARRELGRPGEERTGHDDREQDGQGRAQLSEARSRR